MIISFETSATFEGGRTFFNVKKAERNVLMFPIEGVDIQHVKENIYRIFFDTEIELEQNHTITPIIHYVKKLYLRKEKIKKITKG